MLRRIACSWGGLLCLLLGTTAGIWLWLNGSRASSEEIQAPSPEGLRMRANRLAGALSPYLQQHADDPVDWYPWGEEALEKARREDRPIFLSVGYSACYWCYLMERLVFSDPEIAALMNAWFVNVKVDREERPDLDRIYLIATQLLTGHGGWPNSVFLTPELKPFFAGTYFPPRDEDGLPGFPRVLRTVHEAWKVRRAEVLKTAAQVAAAVRELEVGQSAPSLLPDTILVNRALAAIQGRYDAEHGGFGEPPKFPPCAELEFLLAAPERNRDPRVMEIVRHTLKVMARGGIYDQVGGGFYRYATDADWRWPHFEKMLYTQAQLAHLYLQAYQLTGEEEWRQIAEETFAFVQRELTAAEGGFWAALSAQSHGQEGAYYRWNREELRVALGREIEAFFQLYALEPGPADAGGVLYLVASPAEKAAELGIEAQVFGQQREAWRSRLLRFRQERPSPLVDDKVIAAWNGLMIAAYTYGYEILGREEYRQAASRAARFALARMIAPDGGLRRFFREGKAWGQGYLEDYAFSIWGFLSLYRATGEASWRQAAESLVEQMCSRFWDDQGGGFFFAEASDELMVRGKSGQDGVLPTANAVAVHCLLDLAAWTGRKEYWEMARKTLCAFGSMMRAQPGSFVYLITAAERYLRDIGVDGQNLPAMPEPPVQGWIEVSTVRPVPGQRLLAIAHLEIGEGWHLNPWLVAGIGLVPAILTVDAELPIEVIGAIYPEAVPLRGAEIEKAQKGYQGHIEMRVELRLPTEAKAGTEGNLHLRLRYQACDGRHCLPPAEIIRSVRLQVRKP